MVNPCRAASASRRSMPLTRRRSPASPTSPIITAVWAAADPYSAEASATATARSDDGSVSRMPPTVDR